MNFVNNIFIFALVCTLLNATTGQEFFDGTRAINIAGMLSVQICNLLEFEML